MNDLPAQTNPLSCAYLRQHGIDPSKIPVDGWDRHGYQIILEDNGRTLLTDQGRPQRSPRISWPEGFDYDEFVRLWGKDRQAAMSYQEGHAAIATERVMREQKYDPVVVAAKQAEKYAEADRQMDIADAFREHANDYEREALRIRAQGDAIGRLITDQQVQAQEEA